MTNPRVPGINGHTAFFKQSVTATIHQLPCAQVRWKLEDFIDLASSRLRRRKSVKRVKVRAGHTSALSCLPVTLEAAPLVTPVVTLLPACRTVGHTYVGAVLCRGVPSCRSR